ncbi:MAG TPA: tetratricopeptide repeat protein, partial [Pyrinomonadaceae bacterium]|nr:tetratricopeptide repeat protein [Pyrinomonadaceae bacterium]
SGRAAFNLFFSSLVPLLFVALVFVPVLAFIANLFERRARIGLVIQQEYAALASTVFYAWAAASLLTLPLALLANVSGFQENFINESLKTAAQWQESLELSPEAQALFMSPQFHAANLFQFISMSLFGLLTIPAVRQVFRLSMPRAFVVVLLSGALMFIIGPVLMPIFGTVVASPFLLLLLFFLLRGYIGDVTRSQRARASFKQNLEAATLNPADASAHYNLGLIHQQRGEMDEARQRFQRAIEIDAEELDAHYQLGRIARAQGQLAEAIKHFEQVVAHDQTHAQHEIWREIGATYLAAGQYSDARDALERFLDQRQSDPEGLYLMGRAHAGLGHQREAAASMQACIEAVRTAPAYKYRTEKRWLNEAQQFLKTREVMSNE